MGNRGQKRSEAVEEMPADKRACSSLEIRPSSSNSSVQAPIHSNSEPHNGDMDTSSSASWSTRSDGEAERDSAYGSCDSDGDQRRSNLREYYQRQRSMSDYGKFQRVLSSLGQEIGESKMLAALTELCELLSFCADSSLSGSVADSLSPILVKLARNQTNPDIMLLSVRAITYLCDAHPRSSGLLVRHDVVPALCQRLMAIEYLDVAEQCLQALEKISLEQPLVCLQSGAIMAVLTYIDFFSTNVQRVALLTVVNICKKLPSECPSPFMEAVPILCNLLQYEDRQLVEHVATCLIKITERVHHSSDMLDQLCKHDLIQQTVHLISLNCRTTLSRQVHSGMIGLLVKLASGSIAAVENLFELHISTILKDILWTHGLSHGTSPCMGDGHRDQVHEVLKLLNELLPSVVRDEAITLNCQKEALLTNKPGHLMKFGTDLLSVLIQVVNSGANLYICYGCLSVINRIVHFSNLGILIELLKDTDMSSFLAGILTREDHHVIMLALQIADDVLRKLSDLFLNSFIKEGVFFSIETLLVPETSKKFTFPSVSDIQLSDYSCQKSAARNSIKCLCYAFDTGQSASASERICRLGNGTLYNFAKQIRTNYFPAEILNHEQGVTDVLHKLRSSADTLTEYVNISLSKDCSRQHREEISSILYQIMSQLSGGDPVSTFELLESGIAKALLKCLCNNRQFLERKNEVFNGSNRMYDAEKRVDMFGRLLLSSHDAPVEYFAILNRKLQIALSSIENFPVIRSHSYKQRAAYAIIPLRRCLAYPALKIQFVRAEGETCLNEYSEDVVTVDSFSSLDAIEKYLWPKVGKKRTGNEHTEAIQKSESSNSSYSGSIGGKAPEEVESDGRTSDMQQDHAEVRCHSSSEDTTMSIDYSGSSHEDTSPKLLFYLEGQQIDQNSSLYQAIIQQQNNAGHGSDNNGKLWSQLYKITYRKAVGPSQSCPPCCQNQIHDSSYDCMSGYWWCIPFCPDRFVSTFASDLISSGQVYDVLLLLKVLEGMNRFSFHLMSRERLYAFAEGRFADLDDLKAMVYTLPHNEFVSKKLTEKLEQQLRDPLSVSVRGMPSWCGQLMAACPFLFSFEVKCKYFGLSAFGKSHVQRHPASHDDSGGVRERRLSAGVLPRKKFLVCRDRILESVASMMDLHACQKVILEVEYKEEVGTGLGPTLEFFTLVGHEFQKNGLGMWREDHILLPKMEFLHEDTQMIGGSSCQLFPRPWSSSMITSNGIEFSEVLKKFSLLGQVAARVLHDGRVLDIPFSRAFYKLMLGQELTPYDIYSFDPELGKALLEFQAIVERKKHLESVSGGTPVLEIESCFRNTTIENLCLDFTLPGYPDYVLSSGSDPKLVNMSNLDKYVSLVVDATISSGISRQVEAFKSGFNQVFPINHLKIFNEEELEKLLCGECELWSSNELLDHVKFDHGYTASSPPILNLLEIIQEFDREHQRAFLQFVTGAPRLPRGGLASLNPKLTIVRKHCSKSSDEDLPSVMTCANYLKLPPYSSKEMMKEKLLYAITEGQGSFHLS